MDLIEQALTHRSAGSQNYERLEFLGDALLGFVIAEDLLQRFPAADEGELSRRRAALVKKESLAELARGLRLGDYMRLGSGELRTGGHARDSILADTLEALFGAIYLEQGFASARQTILKVFAERLVEVADWPATKDPKTRLQELLQARHASLPDYEVAEVGGKQHAQHFVVRCRLPELGHEASGDGSSRRRAEQQAAENMLQLLTRVEGAPAA